MCVRPVYCIGFDMTFGVMLFPQSNLLSAFAKHAVYSHYLCVTFCSGMCRRKGEGLDEQSLEDLANILFESLSECRIALLPDPFKSPDASRCFAPTQDLTIPINLLAHSHTR